MDKIDKLEACRFCGKESKGHWDGPYVHVSGAPDTLQFYSIVCNGCCSTASYESREAAITKWNSRASVARTLDVKWRRPKTDEILECHGLTPEQLAFRIRCVIRMCGSVELLDLAPTGTSPVAAPVDVDLISRQSAVEVAEARLKDVPNTVDLEADRHLFAAGYLAAAGSIKAGLQRLPASPATDSTPAIEAETLLRSWVVCMRQPRPSDWEEIVTNLITDTEEFIAPAAAVPVGQQEPIDMLLFCPNCREQHIDAEESETNFRHKMEAFALVAEPQDRFPSRWTNPPHRSHLCHKCGAVWRPADVPTSGVARISTSGSRDTWTACPATPTSTESLTVLQQAMIDHDNDMARLDRNTYNQPLDD